jgi:hypothetical protein
VAQQEHRKDEHTDDTNDRDYRQSLEDDAVANPLNSRPSEKTTEELSNERKR